MLEKNYLNPEDAARFGFRQKGTYKASRKSETAVSAVLFGVMIVAAVLIIGAMASFARTMITTSIEPGNVMLFYLLTSAFGSVVGVTADVLIMLLIMRMYLKGYDCEYIADEEKITFRDPRKKTSDTFYYRDVRAVHFEPRSIFKQSFGYYVTIALDERSEEFGIVSDKYSSERFTPFYIIVERKEINERVDKAAELQKEYEKSVGTPTIGVEDYMSRLEELAGTKERELAEPNEIPELRRETVETSENAQSLPAEDPRLVPLEPKAAPVSTRTETFTDSYGVERLVREYTDRGTFNVAWSKKANILLWIITAPVIGYILFYIFEVVSLLLVTPIEGLQSLVMSVIADPIGTVVMPIMAVALAILLLRIIKGGTPLTYKANELEFVVYKHDVLQERILISDVKEVIYTPTKFLKIRDRGYRVTIVTEKRDIVFNYVFPGFSKNIDRERLPFELLKKSDKISRE